MTCFFCKKDHEPTTHCEKWMPMEQKHIELIAEGKKWTTLRSKTKKNKHPYPKTELLIPTELTEEIIRSEGYKDIISLINELKKLGHKNFPKLMWLYDLTELVPPEHLKAGKEQEKIT